MDAKALENQMMNLKDQKKKVREQIDAKYKDIETLQKKSEKLDDDIERLTGISVSEDAPAGAPVVSAPTAGDAGVSTGGLDATGDWKYYPKIGKTKKRYDKDDVNEAKKKKKKKKTASKKKKKSKKKKITTYLSNWGYGDFDSGDGGDFGGGDAGGGGE